MRVIAITLKKELMSYLFNPVAYVILVLFYLFRGLEVHALTGRWIAYDLDVDYYPGAYMLNRSMNLMLVLVPPILTMRCFAEEKRTGSLEVLLTAPVRDTEVVLGKWLAALVFYALLWMPTLLLLWIMSGRQYLAADLAFGPVISGYLGIGLLGGMLLAFGVFTSTLTDNQLLASLTAMIFNVALLAAPDIAEVQLRSEMQEHAWLATLLDQINVGAHLSNWFMAGLVDTSRLAVFVAGTGLFLFFAIKSLEARRWR